MRTRSGFSMIELVFVIVILGVLAAVAVPRFVATRTDAQVATARSDLASAQKAIVAKVFADNIDATLDRAPDPNIAVAKQTDINNNGLQWGKWILEVAGLDGSRWSQGGGLGIASGALTFAKDSGRTIQPVGNVKGGKAGCGDVLGIHETGNMVFAPQNLNEGDSSNTAATNFCWSLKKSYESSGGPGNKIVPLASSGTVEF